MDALLHALGLSRPDQDPQHVVVIPGWVVAAFASHAIDRNSGISIPLVADVGLRVAALSTEERCQLAAACDLGGIEAVRVIMWR